MHEKSRTSVHTQKLFNNRLLDNYHKMLHAFSPVDICAGLVRRVTFSHSITNLNADNVTVLGEFIFNKSIFVQRSIHTYHIIIFLLYSGT